LPALKDDITRMQEQIKNPEQAKKKKLAAD